MINYNPNKQEKKWQKRWDDSKLNELDLDQVENPFYNLMMFPYPSAEGLHIGSVYTFSGVDTFGRFQKMKGNDVFEPIGLDGFGIHSENYAIKIGEHIKDVSTRTEKHFYAQMKATGNMYDWTRTVETYDPKYYKWTQWLFKTLYDAGLAYRKKSKVNWCPSCKTVLSNEQVIDGHCERCDSKVIKRDMKQWFFKITNYAERLNNNLDWINWDKDVKIGQKNWIGRSKGAEIKFKVRSLSSDTNGDTKEVDLSVYTTAHETIFGCTFMVIAPEHNLIEQFSNVISNMGGVSKYIDQAINKSDLERTDLNKDKNGVRLQGIVAVNPVNGNKIPIFVADYVLASYGTGAIMAVPGHDERDYEFAQKYKIDIISVVEGIDDFLNYQKIKQNPIKYIISNSDKYNGVHFMAARADMLRDFERSGFAKLRVNYRLRDWTVSRQRYWGPPIPMLHTNDVTEGKQLPSKVISIFDKNSEDVSGYHDWITSELLIKDIPNIQIKIPFKSRFDDKYYMHQLKSMYSQLSDLERSNLVIYGSFLTCISLLKFGQMHKVRKLVLVRPACPSILNDRETMSNTSASGSSRIAQLEKFLSMGERDLNFNKINNNVDNITIILSENDKYVPFISTKGYFEDNVSNVYIKSYKNAGEFTSESGYHSFNGLLDEITFEEKWMSVPEEDLPVILPNITKFEDILPDGSGKGPLEKQDSFIDASSEYGVGVKRETDVSDPFVDSAWYFLRYPFTELDNKPFEFVKRSHLGTSVDLSITFKDTAVHIYRLLDNIGIFPMMGGLLELFGLNGFAFKQTDTIKIIFNEKSQLKSAKNLLIMNGGECVDIKESGVISMRFDGYNIVLSNLEAKSYLGYKIKIFGINMRVVDPHLLRKYLKTGKDDLSIQVVDHWLKQRINKWFPVTSYIGGKEHTVLHLLYARFITMALNDLGYIDFEEPFIKFYGHGLITKDGAKMSKSKGNVINPDEYFDKFGADPVRMYLRFLGPFNQGGNWQDTGMNGIKNFMNKVWTIVQQFVSQDIDMVPVGAVKMNKLHQTIKGVEDDLGDLRFNTVVSKLMELINWYKKNDGLFDNKQIENILEKLILMLAPLAPHFSEELWEQFNTSMDSTWRWSIKNSVHSQPWPKYEKNQLIEDNITIAVQINGKLRGTFDVQYGVSQEAIYELILNDSTFKKYNILNHKKIIYVQNKIINIIV